MISIHALLAESDRPEIHQSQAVSHHFYPRSPCGERLGGNVRKVNRDSISIHALLAESDHHRLEYRNLGQHFYPRSPCGERRAIEKSTV